MRRRRPPRLLIVGGAGRMGRLFAPLFTRRGYDVVVADPAGAPRGTRRAEPHDAAEADVIVVSVPLPVTAEVLAGVLARRPRGLVVEMASVKKGLATLYARAAKLGVALASVHPMFGPSSRSIHGKDLILCDTGDAFALAAAKRLFSGDGLTMRTMPVKEHDAWIARTMGIAHLAGLLGASSLAARGVALHPEPGLSSSSFRRLLALAGPLLADDPDLLYVVQQSAPRGLSPAAALARELEAWRDALAQGPEAFSKKLRETRERLGPA